MTHAETAARAALRLLSTRARGPLGYAQWLQERIRIARLLAEVPHEDSPMGDAVRAAHALLAAESSTWVEAVQWARDYRRVEKLLAKALATEPAAQ